MQHSIAHIPIIRFSDNSYSDVEDNIAIEEPLEIVLLYAEQNKPVQKTVSVTMRTPGSDEELATGFLFTEGIIQSKNQVKAVQSIGNNVLVVLHENVQPILHKAERNFYTTSSCGVCGKTSIDAIKTTSAFQNTPDNMRIKADVLLQLSDAIANEQLVFRSTGGLHASALFTAEGSLIFIREDVGRHNALDKIIGSAFLQNLLPLSACILLLSGRASFELIQKAAMAGIKVVVAVGAPSSLAVQLAQEAGMTLIGFLRSNRFNIYTGKQRVMLNDE